MTVHRIETAREEQAAAIAAIYAHAAETSPATFDVEGKSADWWRDEIARADPARGHMTIVALDGDTVLGYAKSGMYMERAAYDTTCLTSVYVGENGRGRGTGGALYDELLARLDRTPDVKLAVAGIAEPNEASTRLHVSKGFTYVGTFTGVGTKFGRQWDVSWYERRLRDSA
jgi:phosphinothricin acetyltransferase